MAQASNFIIGPGEVFSGLTAADTAPIIFISVSSGGTLIDAVTFNTSVFQEGGIGVYGCTAIGTTILSGGHAYVFPGGVASDTVVSASGYMQVDAGAVSIDTQIIGGYVDVLGTGEVIG